MMIRAFDRLTFSFTPCDERYLIPLLVIARSLVKWITHLE